MRWQILLGALLLGGADMASAASSPGLESLEQQLASMLGSRSAEYGIAALDLKDGSIVSINGGTPYPMASTVKVAIAAAYLSQVEHGRRSMDDVIGTRSAAKLMELMITRSDNIATDLLLHNLGGPRAVDTWLRFNGVSGIRVDRTIAQLLRDPRNLADVKDTSTPLAMVDLLRKLDSGNALTAGSRTILFELMSRCSTGTRRIRALLPYGTRVEDKTGTLNGVTNDVGFITMPDGRRVAIAIFARGGADRQRGIAESARLIYDSFTGAVRRSLSVLIPQN